MPLAPSPWLQDREPARTCCPGAAQGRSSKSPSAFRWKDGNLGFCSPSMRLRAGIPSAGNPTPGAWTTCADAGGGEGQGPFQMSGKSGRKRERPAHEGQVVGGMVSPALPPVALRGLRPLRECPCPAGRWTGCRLAGWTQVCPDDRVSRELPQHRRCSTASPCPLARRQSTLDPEPRPQPRWSCLMQDRTLPAKRVPVPGPTQMRLHR